MRITVKKIFFLLLFSTLTLNSIALSKEHTPLNILPFSGYYVDENNLSKEQIKLKIFTNITTPSLTFGYVPEHSIWIKFTLKNSSPKALEKVIEFHALVERVTLYDGNKSHLSGMSNEHDGRAELSPSFKIQLKPYEERTFFMKTDSTFTALIVKIMVWDKENFNKELTQYTDTILMVLIILLFLFFYNLIIFLFTKDQSYFWYILYLLAVMFSYALYTGLFQLFFLSEKESFLLMQYLPLSTAFLVVSMIMFVRLFLRTYQFPTIERALKFYLYVTPFVALLASQYTFFRSNMMGFFMPLGLLLFAVGVYSYYKGVKEALFYLVGWSFVLFSLTTVLLRNLGIFDITEYISYVNSKAFLLETFLFSIALAHKIKLLNEENQKVQERLIDFQKQEQIRLEKLVFEKTKNISQLLEKKALLYKELNHRIKNNLQMMLSLIKL